MKTRSWPHSSKMALLVALHPTKAQPIQHPPVTVLSTTVFTSLLWAHEMPNKQASFQSKTNSNTTATIHQSNHQLGHKHTTCSRRAGNQTRCKATGNHNLAQQNSLHKTSASTPLHSKHKALRSLCQQSKNKSRTATNKATNKARPPTCHRTKHTVCNIACLCKRVAPVPSAGESRSILICSKKGN